MMKLGLGYRNFEGPEVTVLPSGVGFGDGATHDVDSENHSVLLSLTVGL